MYRGKTIAVVVPAYNEAGQVGAVLEGIPAFVDRIYAIDDRSTDGTWTEIRRHAEVATPGEATQLGDGGRRSRVVPIRHEQNRGVGAAIKTGYLRARADGMDVTAVMAGDGQMNPDHLSTVIEPVVDGRADYAKGNRLRSSEDRSAMPRFRLFGNAILTLLTKIASGYWEIGDPQNGYTAISLSALETIDVEELFEFYGYCNDLLVRLNVNGLRVADVPVPAEYGDETSHISYREYIPRVSWMLLQDFLWRLRRKYVFEEFHPLVVLYAGGGLGVAAALARAVRSLVRPDRDDVTPLGLLATLLISTIALSVGMAWDRRVSAHLNTTISGDPDGRDDGS